MIQQSHSWYLPKEAEHLCPQKTCAQILNCQNLDTVKMANSRWMNKWTVVHPDSSETLFSTKKEMRYQAMKWRHGGTYYSVKEANLKGLHTVTPNYRTFQKRGNCRDSKKVSGCHGCMQEVSRLDHRGFWEQWWIHVIIYYPKPWNA